MSGEHVTEGGLRVRRDARWWAGFLLSLFIGHAAYLLTGGPLMYRPGAYRDMVDLARHHGDRGYPRRRAWPGP